MGQIFKLANEYKAMEPAEIERLLESDDHPVRVGAVSIIDWQARDRKSSADRRRELFDLYIRRHDRIDTWISSTAARSTSWANTSSTSRGTCWTSWRARRGRWSVAPRS